jgi:hypothetical protein
LKAIGRRGSDSDPGSFATIASADGDTMRAADILRCAPPDESDRAAIDIGFHPAGPSVGRGFSPLGTTRVWFQLKRLARHDTLASKPADRRELVS